MIIVFLLLPLICMFSIKKQTDGIASREFISQQTMMPWKGIFICWIFVSHLMGDWKLPFNKLDNAFNIINDYFGQIVVVLFLFLSGYGVMYSIDKKEGYLKSFLCNRIFITWLNFALVVILYLTLQSYFGINYCLKYILKAFIGLESVGNSNWYIFCILYLYASTYVSFYFTTRFIHSKHTQFYVGALGVFIFAVVYSIIFRYILNTITVWYDSIFCYVLGILFYFISNSFFESLSEKNTISALIFVLPFIYIISSIYQSYFECNYLIMFNIKSMLTIAWILVISIKYKIQNRWLYWCGENLFWIYILHRISFIILNEVGITNLYLYFAAASIITVLLVKIIKPIIQLVDKMVFNKINLN